VAGIDNLKPFQPGYDERRGSKPKGAIHLSTMIQNYLNENVDPDEVDSRKMGKRRMEALITTAYIKADAGDNKWGEWLAKYGYGQKFEVEHSGEVKTRFLSDEELQERLQSYIERTKK